MTTIHRAAPVHRAIPSQPAARPEAAGSDEPIARAPTDEAAVHEGPKELPSVLARASPFDPMSTAAIRAMTDEALSNPMAASMRAAHGEGADRHTAATGSTRSAAVNTPASRLRAWFSRNFTAPIQRALARMAIPRELSARGIKPDRLQRCVANNLSKITHANHPTMQVGERTIARQLWLDLNRFDYTVSDASGTRRPLFDKPAGADHDVIRSDAVKRLDELTEGNPAQLEALSRVANQSLMGFMAQPDFLENSPFRLPPDDTPGFIIGKSYTSFDICRQPDGSIQVTCDYSVPNAVKFLAADGRPITLERGASANTKLVIAVSRDGKTYLAQPLNTQHTGRPDAWSAKHDKRYPRPASSADLYGSEVSSHLRADLLIFAQKAFVPENLRFLDSLEKFEREPSRQRAQDLVSDFFVPGAANELNLLAEMRQGVAAAVANWDALSPQQQREVFKPALQEVLTLIGTNELVRFVAAPTGG